MYYVLCFPRLKLINASGVLYLIEIKFAHEETLSRSSFQAIGVSSTAFSWSKLSFSQ